VRCRFVGVAARPPGFKRAPHECDRRRLQQVDITINRDSDEIVESLGEVWNLQNSELRKHISEFQKKQVHAVAGIGFPEIFFASLKQMDIDVIEHEFPDHYEFDSQDLILKPELPILVTHKDAVKLKTIAREDVWVVPLKIELGESLTTQIIELLEERHHG
ncbi:MAG: tetraacyldisaccharide 4'-kinase, partial [Pseudomonadota bacterium]